ncbi:cysteine desulfurase [Candidatus Saccharibacteria bacterium]|nr:cysteine desulfurase [Candidatus Saccharibacteria bacterium]
MKKPIYLDYAAATPMDPEVLTAMEPYFSKYFYNPSATYLAARKVRTDLEAARAKIAANLGAKHSEIIFIAGATEANNLAVAGVMSKFPEGELLLSAVEHESVMAPARSFKNHKILVPKQGVVDVQTLEKLVNDKTVLISVMMVNNELGTLQPIRQISLLIKKIRANRSKNGNSLPIYLHTDAAQAGNFYDLKASRLGVDLMSINGSKIYGPKQSGVLYVRAGTSLMPLIVGGGQEFGLRSGTENVAGAIGLATAFDIAQAQHAKENKRLTEIRDVFANLLQKRLLISVINHSLKHSAPHILNVRFPGQDNERLMMELDEAGVQVAVGSACSASSDEPSHVLSAIGLSRAEAQSSLRFSMGRQTRLEDISQTVDLLAQLAKG